MPKEEWGVKRICPTTGKRFYDLKKDPIISPYTGEIVPLDTGGSKSRTTKAVAEAEKSKTKVIDDEDVVLEDSEEEDVGGDVDIDDELLEDDEEETVDLEEIADVPADDDES
ncbi:MAG: TIGR02300 family protein [Pseudomonadota bacterium]